MFLVQCISFTHLMVIGHHYMSIRSTFEYYAYMTIFIYILNILSNHFISGVDADMLLSINRGGGGIITQELFIHRYMQDQFIIHLIDHIT